MSGVTAGRNNGSKRTRPRGYAPWNPRGGHRELLAAVQRVLHEYVEHLPLSARQVFYALVARAVIEKDERAYERLIYNLGRARRARMVPFESIRDDGIVVAFGDCFDSVEDFHNETKRRAQGYRRDRQAGQPQYIELWTEASGTMPQLDGVAREYSVPVYSASGTNTLPAVRLVVDRACARDRPTVVLHCGDFDWAGENIFNAFREDVQAFMRDDRVLATQYVELVRVALTEGQIAEHNLPTIWSAEKKRETCQLEALPPDILATVVEGAILGLLDLDRYHDVLDAERDDRAELLGLPRGSS